jgi:hypothetical protein
MGQEYVCDRCWQAVPARQATRLWSRLSPDGDEDDTGVVQLPLDLCAACAAALRAWLGTGQRRPQVGRRVEEHSR